ncbi:MAG TPA: FGGY-family carbohydrate kinase [Acidimicrobiales bacterium]|nr:FGGY-family carbohydrate kinase [Acidimicrobiales bacterium]
MGAVTVGLDIGTTSIKAVAVDGDGRVLDRVRIPHDVIVPGPDMLEHDASRAWRRAPRRAVAAMRRLDPEAVAVTSMVPSLTAVDARGRPMTPGLLYGDRRATAGGDGGTPAGGDVPTSGAEVEAFLRWTALRAPEAHGYWPAQAVANFALGGRPAIDFAVAYIATPVFGSEGWDPEICARSGARPGQLPEVELPGAAVGRLDGSPDGPVLTSGSVDVWCEQLVAGAAEPGDVHVICGTTLIVWAVAPVASDREPHPAVWTVPHSRAGQHLVGGASNAGGLFLDWANRLIGRSSTDRVDPANVPVWAPYPRGERTPYHDPSRRAAIDGLDLTHGPAALRQAAWEASGFVVRHHLDLGAVHARRIVATGGGTKVAGWMQALADVTGLPVHVAAEPEGAARGAAFLARLAAGLESDLNDAARWAATGSVVEPRPEWSDPTQSRYQRFLELSGPPDPTTR